MRFVIETYSGGTPFSIQENEDGARAIGEAIERVSRLMGNDRSDPITDYIFVVDTDKCTVEPVYIGIGTKEADVDSIPVRKLPPWMRLVLEGKKIDAIKAIRGEAGEDVDGIYISLLQGKRIMEDFDYSVRR